jgi:Protein of unknown function (DUF3465)
VKIRILAAVLLFAGYAFAGNQYAATLSVDPAVSSGQSARASDAVIANAFANHESHLQVHGQGIVMRLLAEDDSGSRHQRFIVRLASGQTLLIAHNIDLAPRIDSLRVGDFIQFYGEYLWNEKGGLIHWTHRDPAGAHAAGWLQHQGKRYQ